MKDSQTNDTNKNINVQSASSYRRFITSFNQTVWSVVGVIVLALLGIAILGSDSWQENLNLAPTQQTITEGQDANGTAGQPPQQQPAPQQQPPEPSPEQLACVADELGEERLEELTQGAEATDPEEIAVIESCLTEE